MTRGWPLLVVLAFAAAALTALVFASASRADVVINELRGSGTAADDDFVELLNRGPAAVNMAGWRLDARAGDDSAAGSVTLPAQTIAPRGKLLVTAPGYSLGALAGANDALGGELPSDGAVALIDPANATQDSVRFAPTFFGEGAPLGSFAAGGQYAFVRKANRTGTGDAYGLPSDSNDNAADFALVVPPGATSSAGSALPSIEGVPGPENLSSAPIANAALQIGRLDPTVSSNVAPNRQIADPDAAGPLPQTLYLRRTVTNISGSELAEVAFRVTTITTARSDPQAGQAIIRLDSSDSTTVAAKPIAPLSLQRSLQTPLPNGGGLNALVRVPSISPASPLAPGASINVEYALRIAQPGAFQVILNSEAKRVNDAPTDISLSPTSVAENQPPATAVGSFSTTDPDPNDTHSYSLVTGTGDTDNAAFQIVGNTLQTNQSFDFESKSSYAIRVRSTDDGSPAKNVEKQFTISVTDVNDPPSDIALSNADVDENQPAGTTVGTLSAVDQDSGQTHTFTLVAGAGSTDNGAFQITGSTLQTNQSFNFETKNSYSIRVRATDNGAPAKNVEKPFTITITDVNDPPVPGADASSTVGNTLLAFGGTASVPAGQAGKDVTTGNVLSNDTDEDAGQTLSMDLAGSSTTTPNGGSVAWFADGSFRYTPAANFTGADTLTYKVTDGQTSVNGTVTISVANKVWYVKNNQAAGGNGRSTEPFDTLAEAQTASGANDDIYVFRGDGTTTGQNASIALKSSQRLLGEAVALVVSGDTLFAGNAANRPAISGNPGVKLATASRVEGLDVAGSGGPAICAGTAAPCTAAAAANGATVTNVNLTGNTGGFNLAGGTGTFTLSSFTVTTSGGTGLRANNAGTLTVPSPPTTTVSSTNGPAVDIQNTGGSVVLDSASSTTSPTAGINLDSNGTGTFSAAAGSITGAGGNAVDINAGSGNISYGGTLGNGAGNTADITGRGGGAITLSGNINDTNDAGGGITMSGNTGGSTTFSGATKTLNTGTAAAFSSTGSGHTINLTGGGLDIDTTSGAGLSATGGGTINVTGSANTIDSVSATALNIVNTNLGASNLNFLRVSSGNATAAADPANGIVVNNTGASGGLIVAGDGGGASNGSGGVIQNTTATGIALTSTRDVSLGYVNVTNSGDDGIHVNATTNFTLNRANVNNNGNSTSDDGLQFGEASGSVVGVLGTVAITNSSVSANAHNGFWLRNTSGTLSSFTVSGSTFNDVNDTTGANAFLFEGSGTSTMTSGSISGSTFQNNSPQRALEVQAHETATVGTMTVSGNTFVNNGIQASFTQDTSSNLTFKFINNGTVATPMTASTLQNVNVFSSSQATGGTLVGTISGNRIGNPAVAGSAGGAAVSAVIQGQTKATLLISGNTVRQTDGDSRAIGVAFRGPAPPLAGSLGANTVVSDLTITNNDVVPGAAASGFPLSTIMVEADNQSGADNKSPTVRADIRGNTVPSTAVFDLLSTHIGFYEYDQAGSHGIGQLVDTAPANADATAQLTSTNTGSASAFGVALIPGPITTPP